MSKSRSIFYKAGIGNFVILVLPILIAFVLAFIVGLSRFANPESPVFFIGCGLMVFGWCLLVRAKWPQIRKGEFWAFGVSQEVPKLRLIYRASYIIMIVGYLIMTFSGCF